MRHQWKDTIDESQPSNSHPSLEAHIFYVFLQIF